MPVPEVPEEDVSSLRKHATIGAMTKLSAGDHFPELMLNLAGGGGIQISQDLRSPFTILLFYRGFWKRFYKDLIGSFLESLIEGFIESFIEGFIKGFTE